MIGRYGCDETRQALGVYVLGAIDPAERAEVDRHLTVCPSCREELAGLAALPALLHRVPAAEAERLAAAPPAGDDGVLPEHLLPSLLDRMVAARRARGRRGMVAAVAIIMLAAGAGAGTAALAPAAGAAAPRPPAARTGAAHPPVAWRSATATNPRTGASLTVRYAPTAWGTAMDAQVSGIEPGTVCQFQIVDSGGHHWTVGGWRVAYESGSAWYPASSPLPDRDVRSFEVISGGRVVARAQAKAG